MRNAAVQKEPVIALGVEIAEPASNIRNIFRASRQAPSGDLIRAMRKKRSLDKLDRLSRMLNLSPGTFEAISTELLSSRGPLLGEEAIGNAMCALFDFEPVASTTSHPVVIVGGAQAARRRVALALSQRLEWSGRRVALYSLREGQCSSPQAIRSGGLDILSIGTVDACVDAVHAREQGEMAVVEASCLDAGQHDVNSLPMLTLSLKAEAIYLDDGRTPLPAVERLSGVERVILSGRPTSARFGALLDAAYRHGWAFAGQCSAVGIYHPMTAALLADRFAMSVR